MILMSNAMMGAAGQQAQTQYTNDVCLEVTQQDARRAIISDDAFNLYSFTLSFFLMPLSGATNTVQQPISKFENYDYSLVHLDPAFNNAFAYRSGTTWSPIKLTTAPTIGEWCFLALTFNAGDVARAYFNAELENSVSVVANINATATNTLNINVLTGLTNARLDNIRIDSRTLTASELSDIYNSNGAMLHNDSVIAYYSFEDGTPDQQETVQLLDTSGNNRHLTPVNSPYYMAR